MGTIFGERLKLARKKSGLSRQALSEKTGNRLSVQTLRNYEGGPRIPDSDTVDQLAEVLDVSVQFLLSNQITDLKDIEFRKLANSKARDRAAVEATVIEHLDRYCNVERILKDANPNFEFQALERVSPGTNEDAEQLALRIRQDWQLGLDPIPNMTELLEERGIKVLVTELPDKISGLTCTVKESLDNATISAIVVNEGHTLERRRMTLAHELGHCFIRGDSEENQEKAANEFAGAFLVPREHLQSAFGPYRRNLSCEETLQIKRLYRVSGAALLVLLNRYGIISRQTQANAFKSFARDWRATEPYPIEPVEQRGCFERPQRFERLCYRALAEQHISMGKAITLLRQPLEEIRQAMRGYPYLNDHHASR